MSLTPTLTGDRSPAPVPSAGTPGTPGGPPSPDGAPGPDPDDGAAAGADTGIEELDVRALTVAPARHPVRTALTVTAGIVVLAVVVVIGANPRWEWDVVGSWFFARTILKGLAETFRLTALAGVLGFGLGFVLALMRVGRSRLAAGVSWTFSWIFRSTPMLVQILIFYNLGYLYERIVIGVPGTALTLVDARTSDLMTPLFAAVLGLGLHQAAYASELIRGGILSVDAGQIEAAGALGIPARDRNLRIVLPQAMRAILPSAFNEVIGLVKGTSIVYVIAHAELFFTVQLIYGRTQQVLPMLMVATLWYIVITSLLSIAQYYIERHFSKGAVRTLPPTPLQRLRAAVGRTHGARSTARTADAGTEQVPA
jgi:polar amino acid transport system permease protein